MAKPFDGYPSFEDWLDAVRVEISEEIKDMTPEETVEYFRRETEPVMKEFNLKYSTLTPIIPYVRQREPVRTLVGV
ncbi:MAG: hypothetical protein IJU31_01040 [Synergistaceae bacterium]|nr:hypothetical protein [Synergistaceae bacterium]